MKTAVFYEHILEGAKQSGKSVAELMEKCASWNIRGIEIGDALLRENKEEIKAQGKKQIDLAEEFGVSKVLIIPGELSENESAALNALSASKEQTYSYMSENASLRNMVQALKELVAYGKEKNILVTLEDFDGPVQPFARMYQLLWFMENVPGLKFTLDTGNFAYSDEDAVQAYEVLKDYIVHVHCKDRNVDPALTGEHRYNRGLLAAAVGSGYLPMKEILDRLKESGYEDYLAIEHFNAADQVAFMEQSAAFLQQYL